MQRVRRGNRKMALLLVSALAAACGGGGMGAADSSGSQSPPPPTGSPPPTPSGTDVTTYKYDLARTGANLTETTLTPANVNSGSFGLLRFLKTDGKVDAQPLYLSGLTVQGGAHNVVFVASENDTLYAFDADSGATLWQAALLGSGETASDAVDGCNQITPKIGITSTPVIDRSAGAHGTIFVAAMSKDGGGNYYQRLHALDVTTGAELLNGPVTVTGSFPVKGGTMQFEPRQYAERAALLLSHGTLYLSFTSHCDVAPYSGWVMAYSEAALAQTATFNAAPNSGDAGPAIWMSGGGPAADAAGNVYLLTANGAFETTLDGNGFPGQGDYGNSFLKLSGSTLAVSDYFSMYNTVSESSADQDLGSGGILLLPDLSDASNAVQHLAIGAGKDGNLYVVNRDSMGKFDPGSNHIYQELDGALTGGIWSTPAYYQQSLYYGPSGGSLRAFGISAARLAPASASAIPYPYPGSSPAVSANGTSNGIIWAHENSNPAVLHAYDAADLTHELYSSAQASNGRDQFGAGNKFITPAIADGKVFVGATNGVAVFGLLGE
jgi:outer membrane protein assembly factor BamB